MTVNNIVRYFNPDGTPTVRGIEYFRKLEQSTGGGGAVAWADVTGKPSTFTPSAHTHVIADTTGLQTALDGKAALSHSHIIADTTGLQTALDGKQATLVSGTNIKTVNSTSLLGSGDIVISGGSPLMGWFV